MQTQNKLFEIEREDETLIVTPALDLSEVDYSQIEEGGEEILDLLKRACVRNLVLDFHRTDYYGSTALGFFVKLWKWVSKQNGKMAVCNLSEHEREILAFTRLDMLWPIGSSREEALAAVRGKTLIGS